MIMGLKTVICRLQTYIGKKLDWKRLFRLKTKKYIGNMFPQMLHKCFEGSDFFDFTLLFMFPIHVFCFQSHNDVSNQRFCFQSTLFIHNVYFQSSYYCFQSTLFPMYVSNQHIALDSPFPIYEFCFQSKFIVSTVFFLFAIS